MGFERGPVRLRFLKMELVILGVCQAEKVIFLLFLNDEIAADREVDDGSGNVFHIDGIVDQSADLAGSELIGRLILRGNRTEARIAAACPPPPEHQGEDKEGNYERPVAAKIQRRIARLRLARGRFLYRTPRPPSALRGFPRD